MSEMLAASARTAGSIGANFFYRRVQLSLTAAGDEHIGPLFGKPFGGGQSNARAAASDNCDFSFQFSGHHTLLR
jgi:hypothetical protein